MERKYGPLPTEGELVVPRSHADRWDVVLQVQRPGRESRACAAALGMSWPRFRQEHPFNGDLLGYGGRVWDALIACGYPPEQVTNAGVVAFRLVSRSVAPVEGAQGFSEGPAEGGTGPEGGSESASS